MTAFPLNGSRQRISAEDSVTFKTEKSSGTSGRSGKKRTSVMVNDKQSAKGKWHREESK